MGLIYVNTHFMMHSKDVLSIHRLSAKQGVANEAKIHSCVFLWAGQGAELWKIHAQTQVLRQKVKTHKGKWFECCLACALEVKTMIITLWFKQVGFYVASSAGDVLESTHIKIVVGQWISERYINHLFLQRLGIGPVLFQSGSTQSE